MEFPRPTKSTLMTRVEELEVTPRVAVAEWVSEALVPVIVRVELPVGVLAVVVTVSVDVPEDVMDDGEKEAEVAPGRPVSVKLTVPTNPFRGDTVTV
jgi:hypothetical protein